MSDLPMPSKPPISTRRWALRAIVAGVIACGIGALVGTTHYLALPGAMKLDWSQMPIAIAVFVLIGGSSIGVCIGGMTLLAARRRAGPGLAGLGLAGAVGGALAGLLPGLLGIAGFGSLDAPYAGTVNILSSSLLGAITFVTLWSVQLRPGSGINLGHLGRSAVASIISLGAFGIMTWTIIQTFDLVPSFDAMADLACAMGLVPFSLMVGALLGGVGGAAIGTACGLVLHAEADSDARLRRARPRSS